MVENNQGHILLTRERKRSKCRKKENGATKRLGAHVFLEKAASHKPTNEKCGFDPGKKKKKKNQNQLAKPSRKKSRDGTEKKMRGGPQIKVDQGEKPNWGKKGPQQGPGDGFKTCNT